jgi:glycerol kinase
MTGCTYAKPGWVASLSVLVIDVGTTTLRASIFDERGSAVAGRTARTPLLRPAAGIAEFDPGETAECALQLAKEVLGMAGPVSSVGITGQRASTVLFDATTGSALGPGIGWQDQRTVGQCVGLRAKGIRLAPNQSATKLAFLLEHFAKDARADYRFATLDTWLAWKLSEGLLHVTDATNAAVTGLVTSDATKWDTARCAELGIEARVLPQIVDSSGVIGVASALPGSPPIASLIGDQQASLIGQGCIAAGSAKVTFGSGGMLDCCVGEARPPFEIRGAAGTFPIVARQLLGQRTWGIEAILLAAGTCVEWLRTGLGIIETAEESDALAASVRDSAGVQFVPAFGGLGTPVWDFGARGLLLGLDASTGKAEIARAVLEGIANAGADLLEAVEADSGLAVDELKVDGGMAGNDTFVQLLANATRRPIARSSVLDATSRGTAFLAGVADGTWASLEEATALVTPRAVIEPRRGADRDRWLDARSRALGVVPFLSALEF